MFGDSSSSGWALRTLGESGSWPTGVGGVWCLAWRDLVVSMLVRRGCGNTVLAPGIYLDVRHCSQDRRAGGGRVEALFGGLWRARPNLAESTSTWKRHLASVSDVLAAPVTVGLAETGPGGDVGTRASRKAGEVGLSCSRNEGGCLVRSLKIRLPSWETSEVVGVSNR